MTVKVGEVGKDIFVPTTFNLSSNTELTIKFTLGSTTFTKNTSDGVTAPSVTSPALPELDGATAPADTYMKYTTNGTEFTTGGKGNWTVCANYIDATPKDFDGDDGTLVVGAACL